jgi:hypothetical protein
MYFSFRFLFLHFSGELAKPGRAVLTEDSSSRSVGEKSG